MLAKMCPIATLVNQQVVGAIWSKLNRESLYTAAYYIKTLAGGPGGVKMRFEGVTHPQP